VRPARGTHQAEDEAVTDETADEGLRQRLTRQSEDAIGKLAQDLLENPLFNNAITRAFDVREKAAEAQEVAMGALNIPSAADVERLTRRVRSVSQRLEGIEDALDRIDEQMERLGAAAGGGRQSDERLQRIEQRIGALADEVGALRGALPGQTEPVPPSQERLRVGQSES
jgi:hypothetical protein